MPVEPRAWAGAREGAGVKLDEVVGGGSAGVGVASRCAGMALLSGL